MPDSTKRQSPQHLGLLSSPPGGGKSRRQLVGRSVIGLLVLAGAVWLLHPAGPGPGDHAPMPVCSSDDGSSLRADVNGDGILDEIHDPGRDGKAFVVFLLRDDRRRVSVDEARSPWQKASGALHSAMATRGTFGDFDGDGHVDLALFYSQRDNGDTPRSYMPVHEVRYGPLAQDLSSERTGTIRIRSASFVHGVRTTDQNRDGRAELQVYQSGGDGAVSRLVGRQNGYGVTVGEQDFSYVEPDDDLGWPDFGICVGYY
ncbi:hypothetical protein [Streptomyces sp. NPDC086766]|uniref:hypothetical protein n=1 Tax=Streptomyces sp. NPDC086766 TaxID=3365754 RepID=UPI0037FA982E